jgi:CheY-like chemotaxis protein
VAIILVVDDDPALFRIIRLSILTAGHAVLSAGNGQDALEVLRDIRPDIIVLDLQMPVLDGRAFFRQIEADMGSRRPPVILLSAFGARTAQKELGAEAAMAKPFDPNALDETIASLLSQR